MDVIIFSIHILYFLFETQAKPDHITSFPFLFFFYVAKYGFNILLNIKYSHPYTFFIAIRVKDNVKKAYQPTNNII
ncbi:hypothetical protein CF121_03995 [Aeromonas media]|nr:hypothetical protein CF121_03995 [Aeromonas media]